MIIRRTSQHKIGGMNDIIKLLPLAKQLKPNSGQQKSPDVLSGPPGEKVETYSAVFFGGLAIVVTNLVTVDPLALRRRLSPGLPLSELIGVIIP